MKAQLPSDTVEKKKMHKFEASSVDELTIQGLAAIKQHGIRISTRCGSARQLSNVRYTLLDPYNRILTLRAPTSIRYFAREVLAYFDGSLDVHGGLAEASRVWLEIAGPSGEISSNYGYYLFHQLVDDRTQFDWALTVLLKNKHSRRAFLNINQPYHKIEDAKDFPCTTGVHYYIENNELFTVVYTRSTDIVWGLPYVIGFFALTGEILYAALRAHYPELRLGSASVVATFSQLYERTSEVAERMLVRESATAPPCPKIVDADTVLEDIRDKTSRSDLVRWLHFQADQ